MKKWIIIIIVLAVILFVSVGFNFYQLGVSSGIRQSAASFPVNG